MFPECRPLQIPHVHTTALKVHPAFRAGVWFVGADRREFRRAWIYNLENDHAGMLAHARQLLPANSPAFHLPITELTCAQTQTRRQWAGHLWWLMEVRKKRRGREGNSRPLIRVSW